MGRKFIDCREFPSDMHCSVAISADTEAELMQIAVEHAVSVHHHRDSPELRQQLQSMFRDETSAQEASLQAQPAMGKKLSSLKGYLENMKKSALHSHKWH